MEPLNKNKLICWQIETFRGPTEQNCMFHEKKWKILQKGKKATLVRWFCISGELRRRRDDLGAHWRPGLGQWERSGQDTEKNGGRGGGARARRCLRIKKGTCHGYVGQQVGWKCGGGGGKRGGEMWWYCRWWRIEEREVASLSVVPVPHMVNGKQSTNGSPMQDPKP